MNGLAPPQTMHLGGRLRFGADSRIMQRHSSGTAPATPRRIPALLAAAALALLSACASYSPKDLRVGDPEATVVATMGPPTARHPLPDGGTRLVYARGPMGRHTYMVDLTAAGGVRQWKQVLAEPEFADIQPGWTRDRLLFEFGPPADQRSYRPNGGQIWSYRYQTFWCLWFQVTLDRNGVVDGASYNVDPMCDGDDSTRR
jgi:hypothetical protein